MSDSLCPCGKPLHYTDPSLRAWVDDLVRTIGPCIRVKTPFGTYMVPRHYIALHGLEGNEVHRMAKRYKWEKV